MRVAAIDIGTNTTRLLIAEETPGGFRWLDRRMVTTRLGQGVDKTRALAPEALKRTLTTIADFAAVCGEMGVERLRVTATSAARDARNSDELFGGIRALTGADAELLSGDSEGRATYLGAISDLDGDGPFVVVDIGGGSTELSYGGREPERIISVDVGNVRMFEKHLHSDPPSEPELDALRSEVRAELSAARDSLAIDPGFRLIGVAGTVTQLAILKAGVPVYDPDVSHHSVLSHGDVRRLARRLENLTYSQRSRVKGLDPGRVHVIVSGVEILLAVMETLDAPEVLVSEKDILDGLVIQLLNAT